MRNGKICADVRCRAARGLTAWPAVSPGLRLRNPGTCYLPAGQGGPGFRKRSIRATLVLRLRRVCQEPLCVARYLAAADRGAASVACRRRRFVVRHNVARSDADRIRQIGRLPDPHQVKFVNLLVAPFVARPSCPALPARLILAPMPKRSTTPPRLSVEAPLESRRAVVAFENERIGKCPTKKPSPRL